MSVFVRIEREGMTPRIARIRGVVADVGEDALGVLSAQDPVELFFSLFQLGSDYWLQPRATDGQKNQKATGPGDEPPAAPLKVTPGLMLPFGGYAFTFWPAAPASEVFAHVEGEAEELVAPQGAPAGEIQVDFGRTHARYPLFRNICYRVGSSPDATIPVPYPDVAPLHCEFWSTDGAVAVRGLQGEVSLENTVSGTGGTRVAGTVSGDLSVFRGLLPIRINLTAAGAGIVLTAL